MPRLGRLWRSGARRAQVAEVPQAQVEGAGGESPPGGEDVEMGTRIEEARRRLRETIPSPEDHPPETPSR